MVRFRRSMNEVFSFDESSESASAFWNRQGHGPSFHLDDAIVPARLEHLSIKTCWPEGVSSDFLIKVESVRNNQGNAFEVHSVRDVVKEGERVPVASSTHDGRWPESRPYFDSGEDPARPFFAPDEGADLVRLELRDFESGDGPVIEPTTSAGRSLEHASDGIPGNPLDPSDRGYAHTLNAEGATSSKVLRLWWRR